MIESPYLSGNDFDGRPPADEGAIEQFLAKYPVAPHDYIDMLRQCDGGEGSIGDAWLEIFGVDDVQRQNAMLQVEKYAPGFLVFGTNGSNECYAYDARDTSWTPGRIPMIGMNPSDFIPMGSSLMDFLKELHESQT